MRKENDMDMKTNKEPTQAELIKIAWCDGFNTGFAEAQEKIIFYIKEMGYSVEIPNASVLFEKLKVE